MGYARYSFRDFESYLRNVVGLDEDDVHLILKQNFSIFIAYEIPPGFYSITDISGAIYTMGNHDETLQNEHDEISMKTKLSLTSFGGSSGTLRFEKESFFRKFLAFTQN